MITSSNVKSAALTAFLVSVAQRHARVSSTDTTIIQHFFFSIYHFSYFRLSRHPTTIDIVFGHMTP
jgi:hypothetical protein